MEMVLGPNAITVQMCLTEITDIDEDGVGDDAISVLLILIPTSLIKTMMVSETYVITVWPLLIPISKTAMKMEKEISRLLSDHWKL